MMIFHVDCDAFYASCEEIRNPKLKSKPLAVGGLTNKSIITTANYKAREYGLHSAMPIFMAKKLCPDLVVLPVDHPYYEEKSSQVFSLVEKYAVRMEKVSIDEAYLLVDVDSFDITPLDLAIKIQDEVLTKTEISISIGISYNKFLAKIASDWKKPRGITQIREDQLDTFLPDLPIEKVHGIGAKTCKKLNDIGIYKVRDLLKLDKNFLRENFGKQGTYIYNVIRGIDKRSVNPNRKRKSIGKEQTLRTNTKDIKTLEKILEDLAQKIESYMVKKNLKAKTLTLKIKEDNFTSHTKSITLQEYIYKKEEIYTEAASLLRAILKDKTLRLIGISLSNLANRNLDQLTFL